VSKIIDSINAREYIAAAYEVNAWDQIARRAAVRPQGASRVCRALCRD
jgi:hypothetical protein